MPSRQDKARIFIVSGPSGSGKTTLLKRLQSRKLFRRTIAKIITVTTRPMRRGERQGRDYRFVGRKEFLRRKHRRDFIESKEIFGEYYAVPKPDLLKALNKGLDVFLCIDVRGAFCIRRLFPGNSVLIFIAPPDIKSLRERLRLRSTEEKTALASRLKVAKKEMGRIEDYDYIIINNRLREALQQLSAIIIAERLRA